MESYRSHNILALSYFWYNFLLLTDEYLPDTVLDCKVIDPQATTSYEFGSKIQLYTGQNWHCILLVETKIALFNSFLIKFFKNFFDQTKCTELNQKVCSECDYLALDL